MLINGREYAFKALYFYEKEWRLSPTYFFTEMEVKEQAGKFKYIWPVEEVDGGIVMVPTKEDLE